MPRNLLAVLSAAVVLFTASCPDPEKVNGPDEPKNTFALAPAAVYTVPTGVMVQLPDSVSGGTFSFLSGGGTLSVARILSGPKPSQPGKSFWVEYTGSSLARLEFPDTPGEIKVLYGYGIDLGSIDDATGRVERWTCVPVAESLRVTPGTSAQRHAAAVNQAWGFFGAILDSLPSTVSGRVATQVASGAAYEPTFYNSEDHKYKGFLYLTDLVPITRPMIPLGPSSTDHTVAHEVGHFMNHILCGESRYLVLEAQVPAEHIPGMAHPRNGQDRRRRPL